MTSLGRNFEESAANEAKEELVLAYGLTSVPGADAFLSSVEAPSSELSTLRALEGALGAPYRFWNPDLLDQIQPETLDALIYSAARRAPGADGFLAESVRLRSLTAWDRLVATVKLLEPAIQWAGVAVGVVAGSELDALAVLEVTMGGRHFWHPEVLSEISPAVVDAYVERAVGKGACAEGLLAFARVLKRFPVNERLGPLRTSVLPHVVFHGNESAHRALAFSAGIPFELVVHAPTPSHLKSTWALNGTGITWMPDGFSAAYRLSLARTQVLSLPREMVVWGDLDLDDTLIEALPRDLRVGGRLSIQGAFLSRAFSDDEIRAMAPDIKGEIVR